MIMECRIVVYLVLRATQTVSLLQSQSDGKNGQGLTDDSNDVHYVGVKEVTNNKAWTGSRTSPLQK